MAANSKRGAGLSIVGFVFAVNGLVFSIVGHTAIGITQLGLGLVLIAAGVAAARRALPTDESVRSARPAKGN